MNRCGSTISQTCNCNELFDSTPLLNLVELQSLGDANHDLADMLEVEDLRQFAVKHQGGSIHLLPFHVLYRLLELLELKCSVHEGLCKGAFVSRCRGRKAWGCETH